MESTLQIVQLGLQVLALVLLLYRAHSTWNHAKHKKQLQSGSTGTSLKVATDSITEPWEKKALSRAKTGGGYIRMPYNNQGVSKRTCYVAPQESPTTLSLQCEN